MKTILILSVVVLSGLSFSPSSKAKPNDGQMQEPGFICEAGTSVAKHSASYLGQFASTQESAAASAMVKCHSESPLPSWCRVMGCYAETGSSANKFLTK